MIEGQDKVNVVAIGENIMRNGEIINVDRSEDSRKTVRIILYNGGTYKVTMFRGIVTTVENWNGLRWWLWKGERV